MSDNGITNDTELREELLESLEIESSTDKNDNLINMPVKNPKRLSQIVARERNIMLDKVELESDYTLTDPIAYQKRVILGKQGQKINLSKVANEVEAKSGIGRLDHSSLDSFVVSRKIN